MDLFIDNTYNALDNMISRSYTIINFPLLDADEKEQLSSKGVERFFIFILQPFNGTTLYMYDEKGREITEVFHLYYASIIYVTNFCKSINSYFLAY